MSRNAHNEVLHGFVDIRAGLVVMSAFVGFSFVGAHIGTNIPDVFLKRCFGVALMLMGLPFTAYFKNGKAVAATTSIQSPEQVRGILDREFAGG